MLWGLTLTLLCKESVSGGVDLCWRVGSEGEPWPLENRQERKQDQYITSEIKHNEHVNNRLLYKAHF